MLKKKKKIMVSLEIRSVKGVPESKIWTLKRVTLSMIEKLKATAGMSQQINRRAVAKLTGG